MKCFGKHSRRIIFYKFPVLGEILFIRNVLLTFGTAIRLYISGMVCLAKCLYQIKEIDLTWVDGDAD